MLKFKVKLLLILAGLGFNVKLDAYLHQMSPRRIMRRWHKLDSEALGNYVIENIDQQNTHILKKLCERDCTVMLEVAMDIFKLYGSLGGKEYGYYLTKLILQMCRDGVLNRDTWEMNSAITTSLLTPTVDEQYDVSDDHMVELVKTYAFVRNQAFIRNPKGTTCKLYARHNKWLDKSDHFAKLIVGNEMGGFFIDNMNVEVGFNVCKITNAISLRGTILTDDQELTLTEKALLARYVNDEPLWVRKQLCKEFVNLVDNNPYVRK